MTVRPKQGDSGEMIETIDGRQFLSAREAMAMLPGGAYFDVACEMKGVLFQATWSRQEVVEHILKSVPEIPGKHAQVAGYGLALSDSAGTWFVKTGR